MHSSKPLRGDNLVLQPLGNELMVYNPLKQVVHVLNATAQHIWDLCDGQHTPREIVQSLQMSFDLPTHADVEGDVTHLLTELEDKELLRYS
ncbi:MAG: PqqD family protein [Anaerolineae bacterium]|nr:PqqD family protein [Anaerolineae bacterium]